MSDYEARKTTGPVGRIEFGPSPPGAGWVCKKCTEADETIRVLERRLAELVREREELLATLTAAQAEATRLVHRVRELEAGVVLLEGKKDE